MSIKALQEWTRISKYARYLPEKQRRENWQEQVKRVMNMHKEKYHDIIDDIKEELEIAEDGLKKKLVLGSQRALQFGGPAILNKEARLYNCFSRDTEFITSNGVKSFNDFNDGDDICVLTHTGEYKKAVVKKYGKDNLNKITLKKGKSKENIVYATSDHTWILKDGSRTENLSIGDQLFRQPNIFEDFDYDNANPMEKLYWCYGLVYGDGTKVKNNGIHKYSMIRLCGHDKKYAYRFEEMGFKTSTNNSLNGDFMAYTGSYLKTLPDLEKDNIGLIRAFVRGLLDADGEKNGRNNSGSLFLTIQQTNREACDFIRKAFPMVGVYILSEKHKTRDTNFGKHDAIQFRISNSMNGSSPLWYVCDIEKNTKNENVWCLEVEDNHSFVFPNGIVTGNCTVSYCDRPRFFQEAMWLLLCGCGVGFSVQKHHIDKLPSISKVNKEDVVTHVIEDSIEGWANVIGLLMSSYFISNQPFPEVHGKYITFDYSQIRPEGSPISNTGGKAPGPDPLRRGIEKIRNLIETQLLLGFNVLRPIDAYDIVMHSSDAVLAGGIRRSATICIFSKEDEEMLHAKTGNWTTRNPQRARSNNSVLLLKNETTKEEFNNIMKSVKEFGEPGFVFSDSKEFLVNPCCEIGFYAYDDNGNSGWAFCNLSEINMKKCKTEEDFYESCKIASILGTLQAGYTDFSYLGEITENIVRRESLLGVSMTGMYDNHDISFNPEIQKKGASIVKKINKELSQKLGINQSARTTCVKPSGSASCVLGTSSGIHPHHYNKYFRRVQVNKLEEPLKFFKMFNPDAVKESVWSANNSDEVISFLCEVPKNIKTKLDISALQLLENVKLTQNNWVQHGKNEELCAQPWLSHNVSNTINVRDHEWEDVENFIYENRRSFAGISLLPMSGDKDYAQAPFQAVYEPKELVEMYGDASVFASGLIVHALQSFDNDLYKACDTFLGIGEKLDIPELKGDELVDSIDKLQKILEKKTWIERAKKFTVNYFDGDKRKMTYCLKDVSAWKEWCDLRRTYSDVPWESFQEEQDNTKLTEVVACGGGKCEIL